MDPQRARSRGLTRTVCFPTGNIAPEGSVIKSTAIDPSIVDQDGIFRTTGPVRVFTSEVAANASLKDRGSEGVKPGDIMVILGIGPLGTGMEEIAQITTSLKYLEFGKRISLLTDARFSGFSTGACIGHIGPEALAGGPIGKLIDGDIVQIIIDTERLEGSVDLVGHKDDIFGPKAGGKILSKRPIRTDLTPHPALPDDTRLWAALQNVGGGTWKGCVYDVDAIIETLDAGAKALGRG